MGAGRCARIIGVTLIPLAFISMTASLMLLFPNGEIGYLINQHIGQRALIQAGLWGSGLLVRPPNFHGWVRKWDPVQGMGGHDAGLKCAGVSQCTCCELIS